MTTLLRHSNLISKSSDRRQVFGFQLSHRQVGSANITWRRCGGGRYFRWRPLICCESTSMPVELQVRRCPPLLESVLLSSDNVLASGEWKAVPDIWKSSAERYGDQIALVDPYHDPPSKLTYKQLEQEILEFSEGLRVVGLKPDEKLSLFAGNSCRWLVADQGIMATGAINVVRGTRSSVEELLQIYNHSESVALVVDNPDLFNRIAETFFSKAVIKFIILLWGDKSCLAGEVTERTAVFNFKEIIDLGRESRQALLESHEEGNAFSRLPTIVFHISAGTS